MAYGLSNDVFLTLIGLFFGFGMSAVWDWYRDRRYEKQEYRRSVHFRYKLNGGLMTAMFDVIGQFGVQYYDKIMKGLDVHHAPADEQNRRILAEFRSLFTHEMPNQYLVTSMNEWSVDRFKLFRSILQTLDRKLEVFEERAVILLNSEEFNKYNYLRNALHRLIDMLGTYDDYSDESRNYMKAHGFYVEELQIMALYVLELVVELEKTRNRFEKPLYA